MENIRFPYSPEEINTTTVIKNLEFLKELEASLKGHPVFDHPFLIKLAAGNYNKQKVSFVFLQIAKMVKPFTAALCALMGRAPDVRSRIVLFDNLFEEMGGGDIERSHPFLYLKMLQSMGISEEGLDSTPAITSVRLLNDALFDAILRKPFHIGCAWLGYGGELTIPNNFPYLMSGIRSTFSNENINTEFWERHGVRDQGHSDDATLVLALNLCESDHVDISQEVMNSLSLRRMIWDELEMICDAPEKHTGDNISINSRSSDLVAA